MTTRTITKVLIANRGEIAVRIARAAKDSGIESVAIYADQDRDALHVKVADEAYALHGTSSAETYLVIDKILKIAKDSGANAIHPVRSSSYKGWDHLDRPNPRSNRAPGRQGLRSSRG